MLRLTEAALMALPLAAFLLWSLLLRERLPARVLLAGYAALALCAAALVWFGIGRSLAPGASYVPAHLDARGEVVAR